MSAIDAAVRARLLGHAGVAAIVGTRVAVQPLHQGETLPAITYLVVSQIEHGQPVDGGSGMLRPRIQIDCWADTRDAADALEAQVADALNGFRGIAGGVELQRVVRTNRHDEFMSDTKRHRVIADYFASAAA